MARQFTAAYKKHGKWYLGGVEEISRVSTQMKREDLIRHFLKNGCSF
jgi:hypothetical protein